MREGNGKRKSIGFNRSSIQPLQRVVGKYYLIFPYLCDALGKDPNSFQKRVVERDPYRLRDDVYDYPVMRVLTNDDFHNTLIVLCVLYEYFDEEKGPLNLFIEDALSQAECNLDIRWKEGMFYPSGAEELDQSLVDESLKWLEKYPNERTDYQRALECFLAKNNFGDVIKNSYNAVEGLARNVLKNDKTLDNNKTAIIKNINLSDGWNKILATYIKYAHDYRHASDQRHEISEHETEAYLYMTGLIIRLIAESK